MHLLSIILALAAQADASDGNLYNDEVFGAFSSVGLSISDSVTDECWTNTSEFENVINDVIVQSGIELLEREPGSNQNYIYIQAFGERHDNLCIVNYSAYLKVAGCLDAEVYDGQLCRYYGIELGAANVWGSSEHINEQGLDFAGDVAREFAIRHLTNRQP